jgi:glutamate carboxypeptidase
MNRALPRVLSTLLLAVSLGALAQADEAVLARAKAATQPFLDTTRELVAIESGSRDKEGLDRIADLIAARLKALGGEVRIVEPADVYRMEDTPEQIGRAVHATFRGKGTRKILMIAHMDTVYRKGMGAQQPFRVDGDRAYGLGIADDKQGIAAILHTVAILRDLGFDEHGTLTVLVNGDEEISSPGHRALLTRLGREHDATMSFEGVPIAEDKLSLATAGIASVTLRVKGRASHAGSTPHLGVNALYELAHQIMQMRDLSEPATGLKLNWTMARAGMNRNVIPPEAEAQADVRVVKVADYDRIEATVRERARNQLIPEAKVEVLFERRRPPLEAPPASLAMGRHAKAIYGEIGKDLVVDDQVAGGGTDAAFAALETKAPVLERFGVQGFGSHSNNAEYISIPSIAPRLYLSTRMIMDLSRNKVPAQ